MLSTCQWTWISFHCLWPPCCLSVSLVIMPPEQWILQSKFTNQITQHISFSNLHLFCGSKWLYFGMYLLLKKLCNGKHIMLPLLLFIVHESFSNYYSRKTKRLLFLDCNCWNKFLILFFTWYLKVVWHEEKISIRMSLRWSTCFLIILSFWVVSSLPLVISLFPKWDYRTRWFHNSFFKLLTLIPWYLRALGKTDIYIIFLPFEWERWPTNVYNHKPW